METVTEFVSKTFDVNYFLLWSASQWPKNVTTLTNPADSVVQRCMCSDHHLCVSYRRGTKWYNKFNWNAFIAIRFAKWWNYHLFYIFQIVENCIIGQQRAAATKPMMLPQYSVSLWPFLKSHFRLKTCNLVFVRFNMNESKKFKPKNFNKGQSLFV